jgi:FkbM family methyltransferase
MGDSGSGSGRLARLFLRYGMPFAEARRLPLLGPLVSWLSSKIVPRETLTWIQVQRGPAAGLWLRVNPRTGRAILEGSGERSVQEAIAKHVRPGMTFYDLGANIGFFSLLAAKLVGPTGKVVSFEADPEIAARLRKNVTRNNFLWVTVEQNAVWSEPSAVTFSRVDSAASPDRGQGHVSQGDARAGSITVEAISLDAYTSKHSPPQFIKCDVEGEEIEVFRGARCLLAEERPAIICELHSEENRRKLLGEFSALGYSCLDCDATHILALPK